MMRKLTFLILICVMPLQAFGDGARPVFADQAHYELVYEFQYRANFVERLILECTGDQAVWRSFGYATAPVSNAYFEHVLGTSVFQRDPFTDSSLISRLWQESYLNVTRSSEARGDPADPVLMAQRDVLRMVDTYHDEIDALCDFAFWEEVGYLEEVLSDLLADAESRLDENEFDKFIKRAEQGLPLLRRLFSANPLKIESDTALRAVKP